MLVSVTLDCTIHRSQTVTLSWQVRASVWKNVHVLCDVNLNEKCTCTTFPFQYNSHRTININIISISFVRHIKKAGECSGIRGRLWRVPMSRLSGGSWTAVWSAKRQRIMCSWNTDRQWVHELFIAGVINNNITAQDICRVSKPPVALPLREQQKSPIRSIRRLKNSTKMGSYNEPFSETNTIMHAHTHKHAWISVYLFSHLFFSTSAYPTYSRGEGGLEPIAGWEAGKCHQQITNPSHGKKNST